jgi:hypothetical protein
VSELLGSKYNTQYLVATTKYIKDTLVLYVYYVRNEMRCHVKQANNVLVVGNCIGALTSSSSHCRCQ